MADETMLHANEWTVVELNGEPVALKHRPTLQFSSHNRVAGYGGCNRFNTDYTFTDNGSADGGALSFGVARTTMMACPDPQMTAERAFFDALSHVTSVTADGDRALTLRDGEGKVLLRVEKTA